jgi:hypothetical protein
VTPIFVEWWPEHIVEDPHKMMINQVWAEKVFAMLRDGGIAATDYGAYVKRDGGLYRVAGSAPPPREEGSDDVEG